MEFTKPNLLRQNVKLILTAIFFFMLSIIAIYLVLKSLHDLLGWNIPIWANISIPILLFFIELFFLWIGILDNDKKVVIENNQIRCYVMRPWGYSLFGQIDINEIAHIRRRDVSISYRGSNHFSSLYYIIDKKGKRRITLEEISNEDLILKSKGGISFFDYLLYCYGVKIVENYSKDEFELFRNVVLGVIVAVGTIFGFFWVIANLV